jgi:hypothetical protein
MIKASQEPRSMGAGSEREQRERGISREALKISRIQVFVYDKKTLASSSKLGHGQAFKN